MIKIDILFVEGCNSTPETINLIKRIVDEMNVEAQINEILIKNSEQAKEHKLFGSPTVQINGIDIDPKMRDQHWFGIT